MPPQWPPLSETGTGLVDMLEPAAGVGLDRNLLSAARHPNTKGDGLATGPLRAEVWLPCAIYPEAFGPFGALAGP